MFRRTFRIEQLESRQMLIGSDWTNVLSPLNVNSDVGGFVSPIDVLLIVNELNTPSVRDPQTGKLPTPTGQANGTPPPFYDVNCDGFVTPFDALLIINILNGGSTNPTWTFSQFGGQPGQPGSFSADSCAPKLREGTSLVTSLTSQITVPTSSSAISFQFDALNFDLASQGRAHDAFEAALLGEDGRSLVKALGDGKDSFFNVSEGLPAATSTNVSVNSGKVSLSLVDVLPGTKAQLVLRLVNNDGDTTSSVTIPSIRFEAIPPRLTSPIQAGGSTPGGAQDTSNGNSGTSPAAPTDANVIPGPDVVPGRKVSGSVSSSSPSPIGSIPLAGSSSRVSLLRTPPLDSRGTEFWIGFPDNLFEGNNRPQKVLYITGDVATTGVVDVPGLIDPATKLPFHRDIIVNPGEVTVVELPSLDAGDNADNETDFDVEVEFIARVQRKGIHVVTQQPVAVYGLDLAVSTSDAFLALPVNSLGKEYINLGYENTFASISHVEGTQFLVVAPENETQVTLSPGQYSGSTINSDARILRPNGTLPFNLGNTNGTDLGPYVTDTAGTYSLVVKPPFEGYSGFYNFELIDVATAAVAANFDEKVTLNFPTGRESKVVSFDVVAGQRLYYDSINPSPPPNVSIRLISPSGESGVLATQNDNNAIANFFGALQFVETGKYYFVITGEQAITFDFSFRLVNMDTAPKIALGTDVSSVSNPPGRAEIYRVDGIAGQVLYYDALNQDRGVTFYLYGPGGQQTFITTASDDRVFVLPETSTYFIILDSVSFVASSFGFRLLDLNTAPILTFGSPTSTDISAGHLSTFQFSASAAQTFSFEIQSVSPPFRSTYQLFDRAGNPVTLSEIGNRRSAKLLTGGTYSLLIGGVTIQEGGSVTILPRIVDDPIVAKNGFNTTQTLTITAGGSDKYQFTAPAGTRVVIDGLDTASENLYVEFNAPDGARLFGNFELFGELQDIPRFHPAFLPQSGTYSLTLRGNTPADAGSYRFRVLDLDTFGTPLQLDTITNVTRPTDREANVYTFDATVGDQLNFDGLSGSFVFGIYDSFLNDLYSRGIFGAASTAEVDGLARVVNTGRHYVIFHGEQNVPPSFSFQIQKMSVVPSLAIGADAAGTVTGNGQIAYRMALSAGQRIRFDNLLPYSNEINYKIANSGGRVLYNSGFQNVDSAPPSVPFVVVAESGEYFVSIQSRQSTTGTYRFRIDDLASAPSLTFDVDTEVILNPGNAARVFRIDGSAGETIQLDNSGTFLPLNWGITGPVNQFLGGSNDGSDFSAKIITSGTHYLTISGRQDSGPITIRFRAIRTPGPVVPLTGFNTAVNQSVGLHETKTYSFSAPTGRLIYLNVLQSKFAIPTHTVSLNQGETYLLRDLAGGGFGGGSDLTGSIITSTKPVAVFGGNRATFIPSQFFAADHLVEQLPPTNTWGREFVTMPLVTGSTRGDRFRFLAQADNTQLTINGTVAATLKRGQFHEQVLAGPGHIVSSHPILVAQYAHSQNYYRTDPGGNPNFLGDPLMMIVPPFEQFLANYTVSTPVVSSILTSQRFDRNFINIVAPSEAVGLIEVDGAKVEANKFVAIGTSGFFGAQVSIALGSHQLAGPLPFGVFVYGFGSFDSYGYVGGQALSAVASVGSVVLTPATANPQINNSLGLTARVADASGTPLSGIRVDFDVSGVNPQRGFGFSDANGLVQFNYVGAKNGRDIVSASVGQLQDDSIVDWRSGAAAPQVIVSAPLDGSSVAAGTTLVATGLAVADFPLATIDLITANGVPITNVDAAGNFFVSLFVGPGKNEFEFTAIDSNGQTGSKIIIVRGIERDSSQIDFSQFADVSGSFREKYARSSFNQSTSSFLAETAIENIGQFPTDVPLLVGVTNISDPMILVRDADGVTPTGIPYYDFTGLVTGGSLNPRSSTGQLSAEFFNPNRGQFTYDLIFYGKLNEPPQITSLPPTEVDLNREYRYDVVAIDPNRDAITFELVEAPAGMTINKDNGQIRWTPSSTDSGLHSIDISVADNRLGVSHQRFTLSARPAPANRVPVFTSIPVAIAEVGKNYPYLAQAVDVDGDSIGYRLVTAPVGMTVQASGALAWQPTPGQLGTHTVVIEASDARGGLAQQSFSLLALSPADNEQPVIVSLPLSAVKLEAVAHQIIALDADRDPLTYRLTSAPSGMTISSAGLVTWTPTATQLGVHSGAVEVVDARGGRTRQSFTVGVFNNANPVITSQSVTTASVNSAYAYTVTATDSVDDILAFRLINAPAGMTIHASTGRIDWNVTNKAYEQEPVTVSVADGRGGIARQSFTISVTGGQSQAFNINPFFVSTPPTLASVGTSLAYQAQARDPDGDVLTYDLPLSPDGMVIDGSTGQLGWLPQADQAGMQQVVIRVKDGRGGIWLQSFQLQVDASNTAPIITSTPVKNAAVGIPWEYRLHAQDADGDALTYELVAPPSGLTLTPLDKADAQAVLSFTSATAGPIDFLVAVKDTRGGRSEQRVSLDVAASAANVAPVIHSLPRLTLPAGQPWVYFVSADDPNGDPIAISAPAIPTGMTLDASLRALSWTPTLAQLGSQAVTLSVTDGRGGTTPQVFTLNVVANSENHAPQVVSPPAAFRATVGEPFAYDLLAADDDGDPVEWTLVESPHGTSLDRRYGTLRWTPSIDQLGLQRFVVSAKDPHGNEAQQSFSLIVSGANLAPSILSRAPSEAVAGERYVYGVRAIDPENDPLAFALTSAPSGMTIDAVRGIIRWTPTLGQLGSASATVEVTDARGNKSLQSFQVNVSQVVRNREPIVTSRAVFRARVDALYRYDVNAIDPEGQAINYSLVSAPTGMQIDANSGLITWTPTLAQVGSHLVQVSAQDSTGGRTVQRFAVLARANQAPTITSQGKTSVALGELYHYDLQVSDPEADALSYELTSGPAGMKIDSLGRVQWQTAPGVALSNPVAVRVTDSFGAVATQSFTLAVTPDTTAPKIELQLSANPLVLGENTVVVVQASDNVSVVDVKLTINGQPLVLDANRSVTLRGEVAGLYALRATARDASGNEGVDNVSLRVFDPADTQGPTIRVTAPRPNATVTTLTDIVGSITDDNLEFYRVDYGRADQVDVNRPEASDPDYKTITTSKAAAVDKVLATFDPTMLINDDYVIRILAQDLSGNLSAKTLPLSLDGQLKLGEFKLDFVDLNIPVAGIPITITRSYDTRNASEQGDFGYGWTLSVSDPMIRESIPVNPLEEQGLFFAATPFREGTRVYLTNPEGRRVGFTFRPTPQFSLFGGGSFAPTFVPDPGVYDRLDVGSVPLRKINGAFHSGFFGDPFNPSAYRLTTKSGTVYEYGQFSGLDNVTDRNGNRLEFRPDGIFSSLGPAIQFFRDPQGRISQIIDVVGNALTYKYDKSGDLIESRDQNQLGNSFEYRADQPHYLRQLMDEMGKLVNRTEYGAGGRMTALVDGNGNRFQANYAPGARVSTAADPLGNITTDIHDELGNLLQSISPLGASVSRTYDGESRLTQQTDGRGNTIRFEYDARGNVTGMIDGRGVKIAASHYDQNSQLVSISDAFGQVATTVYDADGNRIATLDALGAKETFEYDSLGRVIRRTDSVGNVTLYSYGTSRFPSQIQYADGVYELFEYDQYGNVTRSVNGAGEVTTANYDSIGRLISRTDATGAVERGSFASDKLTSTSDGLGRVTRYQYNDEGFRVATILPNGSRRIEEFNALGLKLRSTDAEGHSQSFTYDADRRAIVQTDAVGAQTRYQYDAAGNLVGIIDANGNLTKSEYDSNNRLILSIDAQGGTTRRTYDDQGNLSTITTPSGGVTRYSYDAMGRQIRIVDASGAVTQTIYDSAGRVAKTFNAKGASTEFEYNARGKLVRSTDDAGNSTRYVLDGAGRTIKRIDALGATTLLSYDKAGRVLAETAPDGGITTRVYDRVGNLLSTTDPLGGVSQYTYDSLNRRLTSTDERGGVTRFTYDAENRVTAVEAANGETTRFEYDAAGRLIRMVDPLGKAQLHSYDVLGNRARFTNRLGNVTDYTYDSLNRLVLEKWRNGSTVVNTIEYGYDPTGNLLRVSDAYAQYSFRFDILGRIVEADNAGTPNAPRVVLNYVFDNTGNLLETRDNLGIKVNSSLDKHDRLVSRNWSGGGIDPVSIRLSYNQLGEVIRLDRFSDLSATTRIAATVFDRSSNGQLRRILHSDSNGQTLADYVYAFDASGRLTSESHHGQNYRYQYDATDQLVITDHSGNFGESFSYDLVGNRTASHNGVVYQTTTGNRVLRDGSFDYTYDAEGNLNSKTEISTGETTSFSYDHRQRLVRILRRTSNGNLLSESRYSYDAFNRRIAVETNGNRVTTVYDGEHAWADYDAFGSAKARYLFGNQTDHILARFVPTQGTAWYLADRMGTIRDLLNSAGSLINHIDYSSFGAVMAQTNPSASDRFLFTGREYDFASGLYYYRARYYDPALGRFTSQDPMGFKAGDVNFYRYVFNGPTNGTDPSGLSLLTYGPILRMSVAIWLFVVMHRAEIFLGGAGLVVGEGVIRGRSVVEIGGNLLAFTQLLFTIPSIRVQQPATYSTLLNKSSETTKQIKVAQTTNVGYVELETTVSCRPQAPPGFTVWRGDTRSPETIKQAGGFQPQLPGSVVPLEDYVKSGAPSNFVSTTGSAATARFVANVQAFQKGKNESWIYLIRTCKGIDVNKALGSHEHAGQVEIAVEGGIPMSDILGAAQLDAAGNVIGPFIPSSGF